MGKILVEGRDAERTLNRICANNIAVPVGKIVYTQWLNQRGMIEADLTVTRLAEGQFIILSGDGTRVGYIRAGNFGHTLGGSVGLGFVQNQDGVTSETVTHGKFEIDVAGQRNSAKASLRPMYDPKLERVRS